MSRSLILFRHGKSDWETGVESDHDRPLANRGRKAARSMGRLLAALNQCPELAVASTALRAADTLELAATAGNWASQRTTDRRLYESTPDAVHALLQQFPAELSSVMLIGHEPTWSETVALLTGGGRLRFPTAAMARIDFTDDCWRTIQPGSGHLVWFIPPRLVTDTDLRF